MSDYFETLIKPRFSETDMRGHISNTVVPVWLSEGRGSLCREHLGITQPWMVVNLNVNYHQELLWGAQVTVKTAVERIGNSSICFAQEIWQNERCCVKASTTIAALDMETRRPIPVSQDDRKRLAPYMLESK
ncbi:acyl-CoA thioesterase [Marinobacterium sp. D7]|uniref:acyl-CoA thioesterase n=1 Tax=Marinobacterium ramblicola TaxID=2849041 RepID=UPI001C2D75A1|nr:thioesterase family protein [Marinobacterium ramblicola]MBV1788650.1 acyl-CoA thioesterase [Marinobacterium ramblicola]